MKYKIKKKHIFIFLFVAIIFIIVSYSSYREELKRNSLPPILAYYLDCESDKIGKSILNLHRDTILIGAYVDFSQLPNDENKKMLDKMDIYLDEGSQLFEILPKIRAEIPTESLCDFIELEIVKYVSIPERNNIEAYETK